MATQTVMPAFVHQRPNGDFAWQGPEAASATFLVGAVLVYSAGGFVAEAGADGKAAAQKFLDGFNLGGRFDHYQALLGHVVCSGAP